MRKHSVIALWLWLIASAVYATDYAHDRMIVKGRGHGMEVIRDLGRERQLVRIPDGMDLHVAISQLRGQIEWAEPDYIYHTDLTPNDQLYAHQWASPVIGLEMAWEMETGDPAVVIGIVDTGIDYGSPDLADKALPGYDFWNPGSVSPPGQDTNDHGTHVAGTAAANFNNVYSVAGVCPECSVRSYKFLNACGSGFSSDAILAIEQAILDGTPILSNSWGGGSFSQALYDTISAYCDTGGVFVAAAGNSGLDLTQFPHYPSSYDLPCIVQVASSQEQDSRSGFSNYGPDVIYAPGSRIVSLAGPPGGSQSEKPNTFIGAFKSGTSMATPHVSGTMGLLKSLHPAWTWAEMIPTLFDSADQIVIGLRLNVATAVGATMPPPDPNGPVEPFCGDGDCLSPEYCGSGKKIGGKVACDTDCPRVTGKRSERYCCGNGLFEAPEINVCPENP